MELQSSSPEPLLFTEQERLTVPLSGLLKYTHRESTPSSSCASKKMFIECPCPPVAEVLNDALVNSGAMVRIPGVGAGPGVGVGPTVGTGVGVGGGVGVGTAVGVVQVWVWPAVCR